MTEIQGDITPGFRKDHQEFVFLEIRDGQAGRDWLTRLDGKLSSAEAVAQFNRAYKKWKADSRAWEAAGPARLTLEAPQPPEPTTCVNVAFSYQGLERLEVQDLKDFPSDFQAGSKASAERLGDQEVFGQREVGGPESEADALLILGADSADALDALRREHDQYMDNGGVRPLARYRGQTLSDGKEHFGFKDGISQPDPDDPTEAGWTASPDGQIAASGEFILGQPNADKDTRVNGPEWARNGSYAVFRRFRQDVERFRKSMEEHGARLGITPERLAASMVGRRQDGLELTALGDACPLFAHIQKANPRHRAEAEPNRHRIIRRGIPYTERGSGERGLLFLAYQASIQNQFEHILTQWMNDSTFPAPNTRSGFRPGIVPSPLEVPGWDPLVGTVRGATTRTVSFHKSGAGCDRDDFVQLELPQFVQVLGGGYFFSPSISAVRRLAARAY
jgi:Dyp-type peroxidase family